MADGPNGGRGYGVTYLGVGRHGNPLYILHARVLYELVVHSSTRMKFARTKQI